MNVLEKHKEIKVKREKEKIVLDEIYDAIDQCVKNMESSFDSNLSITNQFANLFSNCRNLSSLTNLDFLNNSAIVWGIEQIDSTRRGR